MSKDNMTSFCIRSSPTLATGLRILAAVFAAVVVASPAQDDGGLGALRWKEISPRYTHFDQIRPVLVNMGNRSVFLSRIWPHGAAQLQRFHEAAKKWESGTWSGGCGVVKDATVPIEVTPHSNRPIEVFWQLSTDAWENPKHFVAAESREARPLEGRYRLLLRYSLSPWTLVHRPGTVYTTISPEFSVFE